MEIGAYRQEDEEELEVDPRSLSGFLDDEEDGTGLRVDDGSQRRLWSWCRTREWAEDVIDRVRNIDACLLQRILILAGLLIFILTVLVFVILDFTKAHHDDHKGRVVHPIPKDIEALMKKYTWRPSCPVPLEDLALVETPYYTLEGTTQEGQLIVHRNVAQMVLRIFEVLFKAQFPIHQLRLIEHYQGNDDLSMELNNTSAFNCRPVTGSSGWSQHAYGLAIDINPFVNPYIKGSIVLPANATRYLNREDVQPGMIVPGDICYETFSSAGWEWGGNWTSLKDYQHFQYPLFQ